MRKIVLYCFLLSVLSCDKLSVFPTNKKEQRNERIVASVGDKNLYISDLEGVVPRDVFGQDSTVLVKSFINTWAKKQLFLKKAEENISAVNNEKVNELVTNYRQSLYINGYKERLIQQQLDTIVSDTSIEKYYNQHKANFKLNEELLQIKFIYYGKDFLDKKEAEEKFKSSDIEDLEDLENLTINFKDYKLRDSTWITYEKVLQKIPPFRYVSKEKLLKKSKYIKKEDSLGVYLVAVNEVLYRNDVAPLSYTRENIKQLILHKRKIDLVREIEKILINDAIKNNEFKEY